jgi:DNA-binding MarR family transcriptional regulator
MPSVARKAHSKSPQKSNELEQISFYLGRVYYTYVRLLEQMLADKGLDKHLRPGMGNVLFALFEKDDQKISEIADRLRISRSTMTTMVVRMRKSGLISTRTDGEDGRAVRLKLTPLGRSLEPRCRALAREINDVLCRALNEPQRKAARNMLAAMNESMNEELAKSNCAPDERGG